MYNINLNVHGDMLQSKFYSSNSHVFIIVKIEQVYQKVMSSVVGLKANCSLLGPGPIRGLSKGS